MKSLIPAKNWSAFRARRGFTLVEMMVVIAIVALLAGLIVGLAPAATAKMRRSRAEGEREALITYIESYHKAKGFYPPGNTNDPTGVQTPLFYELTGMIYTNKGNGNVFVSITQEQFTSAQVTSDFPSMTGFLNASGDPSEIQNFCGKSLKSTQYASVKANPGAGNFTVLGVEVDGPKNEVFSQTATPGVPSINPWHYVSGNPTNNPDSYDLWIDVLWSGKTNRVSNWSKDPQPL